MKDKLPILLLGLSTLLFFIGAIFCEKYSDWEEIEPIYRLPQHFCVANIIIGSLCVGASWTSAASKHYNTAYAFLTFMAIEMLMVLVVAFYIKESILGCFLMLLSIVPQFLLIHLDKKSRTRTASVAD